MGSWTFRRKEQKGGEGDRIRGKGKDGAGFGSLKCLPRSQKEAPFRKESRVQEQGTEVFRRLGYG